MKASTSEFRYAVAKRPFAPPSAAAWGGDYWKGVPIVVVDRFHPMSTSHHPLVEAKLAHSGRAIHVFFRVQDRYVRAVAEKLNDMVCCDSCVELFLQPPGREEYINFEINCGGTMYTSFIEDPTRPDLKTPMRKFTFLTPSQASQISIEASLPKIVEPEITTPMEWMVRYTVPLSVYEEFFGPMSDLDGQTWRANLYKCGDETSHPHWASFAPIGEALNFHVPEYFVPFYFET